MIEWFESKYYKGFDIEMTLGTCLFLHISLYKTLASILSASDILNDG